MHAHKPGRRRSTLFRRGRRPKGYTLLVGAMALVAGFTVVTLTRSSSGRWESNPIMEGQRLGVTLRFQPLDSTGVQFDAPLIEVPGERQAVLLVFASTCPSCYANLEAWRETLRNTPEAAMPLGVALEGNARAAFEYASRNLPGVTVVVPRDPVRFSAALGIRSVPFTVVVGGDGLVKYARRGALDSPAVRTLVEVLTGL